MTKRYEQKSQHKKGSQGYIYLAQSLNELHTTSRQEQRSVEYLVLMVSQYHLFINFLSFKLNLRHLRQDNLKIAQFALKKVIGPTMIRYEGVGGKKSQNIDK